MNVRISIVVPTHNRANMLRKLLKSFDGLVKKLPDEIIIIDDYSQDNTREIVENWIIQRHRFDVKYIRNARNLGPAKSRNKGIYTANGDLIAFTDSDCIVDRYWLHYLHQPLLRREYIGVGGRVLPVGNDVFSRYYTFHRILEPPESLKYLVSANCMYWSDPVKDVGGFEETISRPGGEDVGLSFRLYKAGYRFTFEERAIVRHHYRASLIDFAKTFYNYGVGCREVTEKYFGDSK